MYKNISEYNRHVDSCYGKRHRQLRFCMIRAEHFSQVGVPQESRSHEFHAKLTWKPEGLWFQPDELLRRLRPLCFHNAALKSSPRC